MTAPSTRERPWVQEMVVVHRGFRRELAALPQLIRDVEAGQVTRAGVVAEAGQLVLTGLHVHHTGEDALLWPRLLERVQPASELIDRMEGQHEAVAQLLPALEEQLAAWAASADTTTRELAAATARTLWEAVEVHMDEEEREILPLVADHLTVAEWRQLGEHGMKRLPKNRVHVFLGGMLQDATPEERERLLGDAPLLARLYWRFLGRRRYNEFMRQLHGPSWVALTA